MSNQERKDSFLIHIRFAVLAVISVILIFIDMNSKTLSNARYYLETVLYPILVFADSPNKITSAVSSHIKSSSELLEENERLSTENFLQRANVLRLQSLEQENEVMRRMLNSPAHKTSKLLFAEVVDVNTDPTSRRIVINKGTENGVYVGMPAMNDQGLIGQVISASYAFSRILLLADPLSAVPIVNSRTGAHAIAAGNNNLDDLLITNVPRSGDFKVGDKLVTSGLGGVFPEGYPVATVTSVGVSDSQPFADIRAKPAADISNIRYLLLQWYDDESNGPKATPPKKPSDNKIILRRERIKLLIESMSSEDAHLNTDDKEKTEPVTTTKANNNQESR